MRPFEILIPLKVQQDEHIKLHMEDESPIVLKVTDMGGGGETPIYTGPTSVIPQPFQQVSLPTNHKLVLENIVVDEIPHYETSNPKGITFIIGG